MKTLLVTGSSGLVGSACVRHFAARGWTVHGIDNNSRMRFFGNDGSIAANRQRLMMETGHRPRPMDIRQRDSILSLMAETHPDAVIHAAAQPSHEWAADHPFDDFDINAVGTLNLLEAARRFAPKAAFVFLSTNKVYGDAPNELPLIEQPTRWDYARVGDFEGIDETLRIDQSMHSLFGASKTAADVLVQEYGRYYGMPTVCFRCGCLTGGAHAGAEQHGFLAYMARCLREGRPYRIYGHKGKQVRDNLHADDVASACELFINAPRAGEVYNLGGTRANSVSVVEAIAMMEEATGRHLDWEHDEPRKGDHICWISDCRKFWHHYPDWRVTRSLKSIIAELCAPVEVSV